MCLERVSVQMGAASSSAVAEGARDAVKSAAPVPALLVDDLDESAAHLFPLGRLLLDGILVELRRSLKRHASSHGWRILPYASFVDWSMAFVDADLVLIMDKLYPASRLSSSVIRVEAHRCWIDETVEREVSIQAAPEQAALRGKVAVVDDATWSGNTLRELCWRVNVMGGTVTHIVVGAASPQALESLWPTGAKICTLMQIPKDWDILHARDFCPWLPYSGRRIGSEGASMAMSTGFQLAPLFYNAGAWLQLTPDCPCRREAVELALAFTVRLEEHLGRRALVRDLTLLGPEVSPPVGSPEWTKQKGRMNVALRDCLQV